MPIPLLALLAPTIAKTGFGVYQTIKGSKDLKNLKRPVYSIPGELQKNVNISERLAAEGLPQAQKTEYQQSLDRSGQLSLQGLSSRRAGVGALSNVQSQQNVGAQRLLSMDAQARMRNEQFAMQARNRLALSRDKAFDINQLQPYLTERSEAKAMQGAGIQNISSGLDTASSMLGGGGGGVDSGISGGDGGNETMLLQRRLTQMQQGQHAPMPVDYSSQYLNQFPINTV